MSTKTLYAEVSPVQNERFGDEPSGIRLDVTDEIAREIRRYANFVKSNERMYKVEVFDSRPEWLADIPEEPESEADKPNYEISECPLDGVTLNVGDNGFWYAAYIKHTDVEIRSEHWSLTDLPDEPGSTEDPDGGATPMHTIRAGWMMTGEYRIKASSREEAESIAKNLPLPDNGSYVDDSFEIFDDGE